MAVGLFVEEGLRLLFLADASLAVLIGARFYDAELPEGATYPAITLQRISSIPEYSLRGQEGQELARFQITVHADCHLKAMQTASHVRRIIRLFPRGVFPGGIKFGFMQQTNEVAMGRERGRNVFQIAIDIRLRYQVDG